LKYKDYIKIILVIPSKVYAGGRFRLSCVDTTDDAWIYL